MAKSKATQNTPADKPTEKPAYKMQDQLKKFRGSYVNYQRPGGSISLDNADDVATFLRAFEPQRVKRIAEALLDVDLSKYDRLNNGQIRMNSGNRIRNAIKRGDTTVAKLRACAKATS